MSVKNRQSIIFNWDITSFGNKYVMKNVKLSFQPTNFRLKQLSILSTPLQSQGILILNSDLVENHIPYIGLIRDDEFTNCETEFNINKNKVNHSDITFYIERLGENPNNYTGGVGIGGNGGGGGGGGGGIGIGEINILDPLDMDIIFMIEFIEYEK